MPTRPFTHEAMKDLKKGDVFTTEGLLQGLSDEPVEWTVLERFEATEKFPLLLKCSGRYYGIFLCHVDVEVLKKSIKVHHD